MIGDMEKTQTYFLSNFLLCSYQLKASDVTKCYYCILEMGLSPNVTEEVHVAQKGEVIYLRSPSKIMKQP